MTTLAAVPDLQRNPALDRVVATAKRMEEHDEVDRWEFADDVHEAVDALSGNQNGFGLSDGPGHGTGLYRAIDDVNREITKAGVANVKRNSIVGAYATSKAWPEDERVEGANYWAHFELRGRVYDGRRPAILRRLVRTHKSTVSTPQVRLWKQEQQASAKPEPFLTKVERRLRTGVKAATAPWSATVEADRLAIADILTAIAGEIRRGEFQ